MEWLNENFIMHSYKLLRYGLVVYACYMTHLVVSWSFSYAAVQAPSTEVTWVIAAVEAPIVALNGYLANKLFVSDK